MGLCLRWDGWSWPGPSGCSVSPPRPGFSCAIETDTGRSGIAGAATGKALATGSEQLQSWSAGGAADRFGVEAAIGRIVEFGLAGGAGRKAGQAGVGAAERLGGGDRIARPAAAAADERIAEAPVARVAELAAAGGAWGPIGHQRGRHQADSQRPRGLGADAQPVPLGQLGRQGRLQPLGLQFLQPGRCGQGRGQLLQEALQGRAGPGQFQPYSTRDVRQPAIEAQAGCQARHCRPEPHPLHHAAAEQAQPLARQPH